MDKNVAQANFWFSKAAAKGCEAAAHAFKHGPGALFRELVAEYRIGGVERKAALSESLREIIQQLTDLFYEGKRACCPDALLPSEWMAFMIGAGISEEEVETLQRILQHSQGPQTTASTCSFCYATGEEVYIG